MSDVLNRATKQYLKSVNTPEFSEADWVINPDISAVKDIPAKYWKITGDAVSEMSPEEKAYVDAHDPTPAFGENFMEKIYNKNNKLTNEIWYRDKLDTGSYAVKVKENVYSYSPEGNILLRMDTNYFTLGMDIYATQTHIYYSDSDVNKTYMESFL